MATYIMFFTLNMLPLVHVQSMGTTTKNENVSSPSKKFISFSLSLLCVGIACLHEKRGSRRPLNTGIRQKIKTKRADIHFNDCFNQVWLPQLQFMVFGCIMWSSLHDLFTAMGLKYNNYNVLFPQCIELSKLSIP